MLTFAILSSVRRYFFLVGHQAYSTDDSMVTHARAQQTPHCGILTVALGLLWVVSFVVCFIERSGGN